jgi:hypothetical protein
LGEKNFWSQKLAKKAKKFPVMVLYMKSGRFSMGDRNLGSELHFGP